MKKRIISLLFCLAVSAGVLASDFEVRIINYPKEVPQGAPVDVSVMMKNASGHSVVVAKGRGGFRLHLEIRRLDGLPRKGCKPIFEAQFRPGFTAETIPPEWSEESVEKIACDDDPGEWIVKAVLASSGPYPNRDKEHGASIIDAWAGRVSSSEIHIRIVRPTGIDLEAFKVLDNCPMCNPARILEEFPTSTYAGYVLARKIPDYSNPLFHPVPPAKQLMMAREEGKTYVAFPDKSFEQYFQQLDRFMKGGHIPESLRTVLWSFYGDQLVRRGRFTEAEEAFQRATQGTPPTGGKALAYYERAKGFLEAFEAKKQPAQEP